MAAATATAPATAGADTKAASPVRTDIVFVDGTPAELLQQLATYLQIGDEVEAILAKEGPQAALAKVVDASGALNAAPEKEFTGTYNLLIYLVVSSPKGGPAYLQKICQNLSKPVTSSPVNGVGLALNALQSMFNLLAPTNPLRYNVFLTIVRFARSHGLYENLRSSLTNVSRWLEEWQSDDDQQRRLLLELSGLAGEAGRNEESYQYLLKALRTFDASDDDEVKSEEAEELSLKAVRAALLAPTHYDFQDLRALPTVQALADSKPVWSQLLDIFSEQDLEDYNDFRDEHDGWVEEQKLDDARLQRKMRLLTFTSLAASTPSRQIEYARIAHALQVPLEDVELWAIDVIRAGLVEGKMSQQQQLFLVHRTTYRVFGEKQWRELAAHIDQWRNSLRNVQTVLRRQQSEVAAAKERETQELERKLANAGLDGEQNNNNNNNQRQGQRRGGNGPRQGGGGFQQRQHRPRDDNDD